MATTLQSYRICCDLFLPDWKDLPVQHLAAEHIQRLLGSLQRGVKGHKPFAPKTIRNVHGVIHGLLEFGIAHDILERNVAARVKRPSWTQPVPRAWTAEQVVGFLRVVAGDRLEALWWLFLGTGIRSGECAALRWDDLKGNQLTIRRRVYRLKTGLDYASPKSKAG